MTTIKIDLDEETVKRIEQLAHRLQLERDEWIRLMIERVSAVEADPLLGLWGDEADVADEITNAAMEARQRDPLRGRRG